MEKGKLSDCEFDKSCISVSIPDSDKVVYRLFESVFCCGYKALPRKKSKKKDNVMYLFMILE